MKDKSLLFVVLLWIHIRFKITGNFCHKKFIWFQINYFCLQRKDIFACHSKVCLWNRLLFLLFLYFLFCLQKVKHALQMARRRKLLFRFVAQLHFNKAMFLSAAPIPYTCLVAPAQVVQIMKTKILFGTNSLVMFQEP